MERRDVLKGAMLTAGMAATVATAATQATAQTTGVGIRDISTTDPTCFAAGRLAGRRLLNTGCAIANLNSSSTFTR